MDDDELILLNSARQCFASSFEIAFQTRMHLAGYLVLNPEIPYHFGFSSYGKIIVSTEVLCVLFNLVQSDFEYAHRFSFLDPSVLGYQLGECDQIAQMALAVDHLEKDYFLEYGPRTRKKREQEFLIQISDSMTNILACSELIHEEGQKVFGK